ncbi:MAG: fumarylacetoacetate hydrolase family protein [Alphaproteobacteria bacterium]|nr:fumarylacetoacetate hydrolase family protein [Alphaproteobacteria bacterium]MDB5719684.1 fumarylacetoacetate hydrolase family protein [Alphaproteobacteria bacterium]
MKLGTQRSDDRDGRLVVVSHDHSQVADASAVAETLQDALDQWDETAPRLEALYSALNEGRAEGARAFRAEAMAAPLPRAWQWLDGSAFPSHGALMQRAFKMPPIESDLPLMYQGMSHQFLGPREDVPFPTEDDGIDFEGEFGIITDSVPMGISAADAMAHIKLVVQINDWSLRTLAPIEMKTGFGWIQAKPACSVAPVAVAPHALGNAWQEGRVCLPLEVTWNGEAFGRPDGREMAYGFHELIAHAARTRSLAAGTIIGSGTVSNQDHRAAGSTCVAERRGIEMIDHGAPRTGFLSFGDRIRMEARSPEGAPLFGALDQQVVRA